MKTLYLIAALVAVFATGYFTGTRDPFQISQHVGGGGATGESSAPEVATTLAENGGGRSSGLDGAPTGTLEEQMAELMDELKGKSPYGYYMDQLGTGRMLLRAEAILSRADKLEVLDIIDNWDTDTGAVPFLPGIVFQRLAQFSPEEAAAVWLDTIRLKKNIGGVDGIVREWIKSDREAALAWVDSISDKKAKTAAEQALILPLAEIDPRGALARLDSIEDRNIKMQYGAMVTSALGAKLPVEELPDLADEFLERKDDEWGNQNQLMGIVTAWAGRDLDGAIDWLASQESGKLKDHVIANSLNQYINKDPQAFAERLSGKLGEGSPFAKIGSQLFRQWITNEDEIDNALAWFEENGEYLEPGQNYYGYPMSSVSEENVVPILEKISSLPDYPVKASVLKGLLWQMQQSHPKKTLEFAIEHLPAGGENDSNIASMLNNWAQKASDPTEVIEWAMENMTAGDGRETAVRFGISAWARNDPESAMNYVMELPEAERNDSLWGMALEWPKKDAEGALRFIREADNPETISRFTNRAFWELVEVRGGERTLDAAMKMPQGKKRQDAVEGLFGGWAYKDATGATAALEKMEKGYLRDVAIGAFTGMVNRTDPRAGFAWSLQIDNENQRKRRAISAGRSWLSSDRKNAREWIETNPSVPAEIREELLKPKGKK